MEIRKTGQAREIEMFETELRIQTKKALTASYSAARGGGRMTQKIAQTAVKSGVAEGKSLLLSKDVRKQLKLMTPEQKRQWNSYSRRTQQGIIARSEVAAQKNLGKSGNRKVFSFKQFSKELNQLAVKDRYNVQFSQGILKGRRGKVTVSNGYDNHQKGADGKKAKTKTVSFYEHDPVKAQKRIQKIESLQRKEIKRAKHKSSQQFQGIFMGMLAREVKKSRMRKADQLNDEINLAEAQQGDIESLGSYLTMAPRAKIYQKMTEALQRAATVVVQKVLAVGAFVLPMLLPFILVVLLLYGVLAPAVTSGEYRGVAHVTAEVEFYRPYLEKYAALYPGMDQLVDLMLAMIMQEAGGEPWIGTMDGDIMQSSESAGYPGPGYLTGEASIAQGVKYLATEVFNKAGLLEDPFNLDKTKLALQGYNFGSGYIDWALANYGGYSEENAAIFSDMMAARCGWRAYGDKQYVPHVLRYYEIRFDGIGEGVSTSEITNAETAAKLEELSAFWPDNLEEGRQNIIIKGCTLAGYTTYDMWGPDTRSGVDFPRTLDCSSFTAWCFQKCGYTDVPYWSTTGTFLESSNFQQIDRSQLKPGDIGLINWVGSGGSNHVGIYVGTDNSGTPMWLHCTSHTNPGSSIVTGPRISYYSSFNIFFRYRGFS